MTKIAKKRTAVRFTTPSSNRPKPGKAGQKSNRVAAVRPGTKQSAAIEMLRSPGGTTIAALTKATVRPQCTGALSKPRKRSLSIRSLRLLIVSLIGCYGTLFEMLRRLKGWPETIPFVRFGSVADICKRPCLLHLRKRTCAVQ